MGQGDEELTLSMWRSLLNHICNIHHGHEGPYTECLHGPLEDRDWMSRDSQAFRKLRGILENPRLLADLRHLSPRAQTSSLESFNNILIRFAPKSVAYSEDGMQARTQLAVLHFNENASREQARTRGGQKRWKVKMSKARKGHFAAFPVKTAPTFAYVRLLLQDVTERCNVSVRQSISQQSSSQGHHMTDAYVDRPSKEELLMTQRHDIEHRTSCFFFQDSRLLVQ
ncbi:uncharacterized protein LOC119396590 [Rhipicephalus sanguineus]|uniref:uncharacterized protein LOC119396590 n=1 Tax=Rhipicephalus sanguineus TaxID=34632 RepID=UPI0018961A2A|nr:uncharacterized protein LOC119396590 [Rhipicephalus sanguineus]